MDILERLILLSIHARKLDLPFEDIILDRKYVDEIDNALGSKMWIEEGKRTFIGGGFEGFKFSVIPSDKENE